MEEHPQVQVVIASVVERVEEAVHLISDVSELAVVPQKQYLVLLWPIVTKSYLGPLLVRSVRRWIEAVPERCLTIAHDEGNVRPSAPLSQSCHFGRGYGPGGKVLIHPQGFSMHGHVVETEEQ